MLKDDGLQLCGPFEDRVQFRRVATLGHPKLDAHHRSVPDATVEFIQACLRVFRVQIDEAQRAVGKVAQRLQYLVVLLPHLFD